MRRVLSYGALLLRHRALGEILVQRELKGRYRGTVLGFMWSFVSPLIMMGIYVAVFSLTMRVPVAHYPAFVLAGLLPWNCFTASMTEGMHAVIANGNLVRKVHLPAEIFPLVAVVANMVHFVLSLPVLLAVLWGSGVGFSWALCFLPVLLVAQFLFAAALAVVLASLAVQFRDLMHIVPNLIMMWFYLTPVVYALELAPPKMRALMGLNPMSGLIGCYRCIFIDAVAPPVLWLVGFVCMSSCCLLAALWLFGRRRDIYPELA